MTTLKKGKEIKLSQLKAGSLFSYNETLALKSEYRTKNGAPECYIVGSGEFFWGGTGNSHDLNNLIVRRVKRVKI